MGDVHWGDVAMVHAVAFCVVAVSVTAGVFFVAMCTVL